MQFSKLNNKALLIHFTMSPLSSVARGMTSFRYYFPCSSRFHQIVVDCLLGWFNGRIHVVKLLLDQRRRVFRHGWTIPARHPSLLLYTPTSTPTPTPSANNNYSTPKECRPSKTTERRLQQQLKQSLSGLMNVINLINSQPVARPITWRSVD